MTFVLYGTSSPRPSPQHQVRAFTAASFHPLFGARQALRPALVLGTVSSPNTSSHSVSARHHRRHGRSRLLHTVGRTFVRTISEGHSGQLEASNLGLFFEALRVRAHVRLFARGRRNLLLRDVLLRVAHPERWWLAAELVEGACLH